MMKKMQCGCFCSILVLFFMVSCTKNPVIEKKAEIKTVDIKPNGPTPPGYGGSSASGIPVNVSGDHFVTGFAGGLSFTSFPYPLSVPTTGGVTLFIPSYEGIESTGDPILSVYQNDAVIVVTKSSFGTSLSSDTQDILKKYYQQLSDFIANVTDSTGALKQPGLPEIPSGVNSNGYLTYTGTFIIDPSVSVTHVSIANGVIKQTATSQEL